MKRLGGSQGVVLSQPTKKLKLNDQPTTSYVLDSTKTDLVKENRSARWDSKDVLDGPQIFQNASTMSFGDTSFSKQSVAKHSRFGGLPLRPTQFHSISGFTSIGGISLVFKEGATRVGYSQQAPNNSNFSTKDFRKALVFLIIPIQFVPDVSYNYKDGKSFAEMVQDHIRNAMVQNAFIAFDWLGRLYDFLPGLVKYGENDPTFRLKRERDIRYVLRRVILPFLNYIKVTFVGNDQLMIYFDYDSFRDDTKDDLLRFDEVEGQRWNIYPNDEFNFTFIDMNKAELWSRPPYRSNSAFPYDFASSEVSDRIYNSDRFWWTPEGRNFFGLGPDQLDGSLGPLDPQRIQQCKSTLASIDMADYETYMNDTYLWSKNIVRYPFYYQFRVVEGKDGQPLQLFDEETFPETELIEERYVSFGNNDKGVARGSCGVYGYINDDTQKKVFQAASDLFDMRSSYIFEGTALKVPSRYYGVSSYNMTYGAGDSVVAGGKEGSYPLSTNINFDASMSNGISIKLCDFSDNTVYAGDDDTNRPGGYVAINLVRRSSYFNASKQVDFTIVDQRGDVVRGKVLEDLNNGFNVYDTFILSKPSILRGGSYTFRSSWSNRLIDKKHIYNLWDYAQKNKNDTDQHIRLASTAPNALSTFTPILWNSTDFIIKFLKPTNPTVKVIDISTTWNANVYVLSNFYGKLPQTDFMANDVACPIVTSKQYLRKRGDGITMYKYQIPYGLELLYFDPDRLIDESSYQRSMSNSTRNNPSVLDKTHVKYTSKAQLVSNVAF